MTEEELRNIWEYSWGESGFRKKIQALRWFVLHSNILAKSYAVSMLQSENDVLRKELEALKSYLNVHTVYDVGTPPSFKMKANEKT